MRGDSRNLSGSGGSLTEVTPTTNHSFSSTVKVRFVVIVTGVRFNIGERPVVIVFISPVVIVEFVTDVTNRFWNINHGGSSRIVNTFLIFLEGIDSDIRETHSFITSTLIDGGSEI